MLIYPIESWSPSVTSGFLRDLPTCVVEMMRKNEGTWWWTNGFWMILGSPKSNRNLNHKSVLPFQHILRGESHLLPPRACAATQQLVMAMLYPSQAEVAIDHWKIAMVLLGQHPCLHSKIAGLVVDAHPSQRLCNSWSIPGLRSPKCVWNVTPKSHDVSSISSIKIVVGWLLPDYPLVI